MFPNLVVQKLTCALGKTPDLRHVPEYQRKHQPTNALLIKYGIYRVDCTSIATWRRRDGCSRDPFPIIYPLFGRMTVGQMNSDHRLPTSGSLVCDNGLVKLRIVHTGLSLGILLEADGETCTPSLFYAPSAHDCHVENASGERLTLQYFTFDPVQQHGETCGVMLRGVLGGHPATLTATLEKHSIWCRVRFQLGPASSLRGVRLAHRWQLVAPPTGEMISWPPNPVRQEMLVENPAAFMQCGSIFSALAPDLEEGDYRHLGLNIDAEGTPSYVYGAMATEGQAFDLGTPLRFAYTLGLDADAIPRYGFQHVIRLLGYHDALKDASAGVTRTLPGKMPPLPSVYDCAGWVPFLREGSPAHIAALTQYYLSLAEDEWRQLDQGLYWLDRLCYHQRLYEIPGGPCFGSLGGEWGGVGQWMPCLLFEAFHLTGISEYAYRGNAALGALPDAERGVVIAHLRERFGDIYLDADRGGAVLLTELDAFHTTVTPDGIQLEIACHDRIEPLQLVLEGCQAAYTLTINGESLGLLPTAILRAGIEVPLALRQLRHA